MLYELKMQERFDAVEDSERNRTILKLITRAQQRGADHTAVIADLADFYDISKAETQRYYDQAQLTDSNLFLSSIQKRPVRADWPFCYASGCC